MQRHDVASTLSRRCINAMWPAGVLFYLLSDFVLILFSQELANRLLTEIPLLLISKHYFLAVDESWTAVNWPYVYGRRKRRGRGWGWGQTFVETKVGR